MTVPYGSQVGESFMEGFIRAFAPSVPVTIRLDHPVTPEAAAAIRAALLPPKRVYRGRLRTVFHDVHHTIAPVEWYPTAEAARAAGLRPCRVCKPT